MEQCRWSLQVAHDAAAIVRRQATMSWTEIAIFLHLITGRAVGPRNASFLVLTAVSKHLWSKLAKHFEVVNASGDAIPLRKWTSNLRNAGAAITCGLPNLHGIDKRIITDDFAGISISIASLLRFAAVSPCRLCTPMPASVPFKSQWIPSGLVTTVEQARALSQERASSSNLKADFRQARAARRPTNRLQGPCLFGCATSETPNKSNNAWYKVPSPSPWPGVRSGEVLCRRCYLWGIANKRTAIRRRSAGISVPSPAAGFKVGDQVRILGLTNATHFNGKLAFVLNPEDDQGRVLVDLPEHPDSLRLQAARLVKVNVGTDSMETVAIV